MPFRPSALPGMTVGTTVAPIAPALAAGCPVAVQSRIV